MSALIDQAWKAGNEASFASSPWRLCVAPMMDWTDRHCRYFHRVLSRHARLYTEMVATGALIHGDAGRHLDFDRSENPVALQLGGSEPAELAHCARLGERWGYSEINLNCGCPSERVQQGAFGACLMAEPATVADCVRAMRDAVSIDVTVKHRIGIDRRDDYAFVRDFVGAVRAADCSTFIVHARSAWLSGLSPKENREVPPLRYETVRRLKGDFPDCTFVLNGGMNAAGPVLRELQQADGVMLGRAAYQSPWLLVELGARAVRVRRRTGRRCRRGGDDERVSGRCRRERCAGSQRGPPRCWACCMASAARARGDACCRIRRSAAVRTGLVTGCGLR